MLTWNEFASDEVVASDLQWGAAAWLASARMRCSGSRFSAGDFRADRLPGKTCRLMMGADDRFVAGLSGELQGERN